MLKDDGTTKELMFKMLILTISSAAKLCSVGMDYNNKLCLNIFRLHKIFLNF